MMASVKNLFQDNKNKQNEISNINKDMRRLSAKPIKNNSLRGKQEFIFNKLGNNNASFKLKIIKIKGNSENIKKSINPCFIKSKEKNDNEKTIQPNIKRSICKNNNTKK